MGKPLYFTIYRDRKNGRLLLGFSDNKGEFDIPEKVYNGTWKGISVHGGEFGRVLCAEMGVGYHRDQLEVAPEIDVEQRIVVIPLDEVKRSKAEIVSADFLLPQWQYDELAKEDDEWEEIGEE